MYKASRISTGVQRAVKKILKSTISDPEKFMTEINIMKVYL